MSRVSVLFVTYNRSDLLAKSLMALRQALDGSHIDTEFIVTDDGSSEAHQAVIRELPFDKRVFARCNQGLGANTNKGIAACDGEFILQVQDDWLFVGHADSIRRALRVLTEDHRVGIVQLASSMTARVAEEVALDGGGRYALFENDQVPRIRPCGERPYSDQPHMKRRAFCADVGPYRERVPMTNAELDYQMRVANQSRWKVAALIDDGPVFRDIGAERTFNPGNLRARRIQRIEKIPLLGPISRWARMVARMIRDKIRSRWSSD